MTKNKTHIQIILTLLIVNLLTGSLAFAKDLKIGDPAPLFKVKTHTGEDFDLGSRKGQWTVLFFYPKAGTPGCTEQACAFRDSIQKITDQGAAVYGISTDSIKAQKEFFDKQKLNFTLLSDESGEVTRLYGAKIPMMKMSKRWTFIIDPELRIRSADKNVDPALDAQKVADTLLNLKK